MPRTSRIVLVDDDDQLRRMARTALEQAGFEVLAAASAKEALTIFQDPRPSIDLLITDLIMPEMSGSRLAERISALGGDTRILFISGYPDLSWGRPETQDVAGDFLAKPFTARELVARVRKILDAPPGERQPR